jgi:hypothetical protein
VETVSADPLAPQALVGDLDPNEEGITILMNHDIGQAAIVPASVARLDPQTRSLAMELQSTVRQIMNLQSNMSDQVATLRDLGLSWGAIGFLVGTTPQSARQRFGEPDD